MAHQRQRWIVGKWSPHNALSAPLWISFRSFTRTRKISEPIRLW